MLWPEQSMSNALTTIEIAKEYLSFSAAHFTIFSATSRERLHGHNFRVACSFTAPVGDDGLCFDYGIAKKRLKLICDELDELVLLPNRSPHLKITATVDTVTARFGEDTMSFPMRDVRVLPIANITVEALAPYLLEQVRFAPELVDLPIQAIELKVSSGTNQWGSASWSAKP